MPGITSPPVLAVYIDNGNNGSWGFVAILVAVAVVLALLLSYKRYRDGKADPGPAPLSPTPAAVESALVLTFKRDHVGLAKSEVAPLAASFQTEEWPTLAGSTMYVYEGGKRAGSRIRTLLTNRRLFLLGSASTAKGSTGRGTLVLDLDDIAAISAFTGNRYTITTSSGPPLEIRTYYPYQPHLRQLGTKFYAGLKRSVGRSS
jgi:hypothetical protein